MGFWKEVFRTPENMVIRKKQKSGLYDNETINIKDVYSISKGWDYFPGEPIVTVLEIRLWKGGPRRLLFSNEKYFDLENNELSLAEILYFRRSGRRVSKEIAEEWFNKR